MTNLLHLKTDTYNEFLCEFVKEKNRSAGVEDIHENVSQNFNLNFNEDNMRYNYKKPITLPFDSRNSMKTIFKKKEVDLFSCQNIVPTTLNPILLNNIKFFFKKAKRLAYINDLSVLNSYDLNLINDQAYSGKDEKENQGKSNFIINKIFSTMGFIKKMIKNSLFYKKFGIKVIHPYNKFKLIWDLVNALVIILFLFYIPISLSFQVKDVFIFEKKICLFVLGIDIFVEMNTLYFNNGLEVNDRKKILINYFTGYFISDFLGIIAVIQETFEFEKLTDIVQILFLMKIFSLDKTSKKMMNRFQLINQKKGIRDLIYLFFVIILITHLVACAWHYVGIVKNTEISLNTWIIHNNLENEDWYIQYMNSFYWAIVTVMTVGYGDITPQNNLEKFFCIFVILTGCMIFPYSINSIGIIIQDIRKNRIKFKYLAKFIIFHFYFYY